MTSAGGCSLVVCGGGSNTRTQASIRAQSRAPIEVIEVPPDRDHAESLRSAFERATGDLVAVVDDGDALEPRALELICEHAFDGADVVYADEARLVDDDDQYEPFFKPDWSLDRLRCQQYVGRLCAFRGTSVAAVGGVRRDARGACEWDLLLRLAERNVRVEHVPEILYRRAPGSPIDGLRTDEDRDAARQMCQEHLQRCGVGATVDYDAELRVFRLRPALLEAPRVSIIVPTAGTQRWVWGRVVTLIRECIGSIVKRSTYSNYEVVCIADDSVGPSLRRDLMGFDEKRIKIVEYQQPFNFSSKINLGVAASSGDHLVLLNDDTQVITPEWLEHLLVYSTQPGVGAVGTTLRFADGRLQHVGVHLVQGDPGHPYYGFPASTRGYFDVVHVPSNLMAVTAACLMTRRDTFEQVGGFDEDFPANYNDVDFCLKVHASGARLVHQPEAELYHFESSSREGGAVATHEIDLLRSRWGAMLMRDPFYNPNFLATADYLTPLQRV